MRKKIIVPKSVTELKKFCADLYFGHVIKYEPVTHCPAKDIGHVLDQLHDVMLRAKPPVPPDILEASTQLSTHYHSSNTCALTGLGATIRAGEDSETKAHFEQLKEDIAQMKKLAAYCSSQEKAYKLALKGIEDALKGRDEHPIGSDAFKAKAHKQVEHIVKEKKKGKPDYTFDKAAVGEIIDHFEYESQTVTHQCTARDYKLYSERISEFRDVLKTVVKHTQNIVEKGGKGFRPEV